MEATKPETESTARNLLHYLQEHRILGKGFFSSIHPAVLAVRVSAAKQVPEMPTSRKVDREISSKNSVVKHTAKADEFLKSSSIHPENYRYMKDDNLVKVMFYKGALEAKPSPLSLENICLAYVILCDPDRVQNGKPCCNKKPKRSNAGFDGNANKKYSKLVGKQLRNTKRAFEEKSLW